MPAPQTVVQAVQAAIVASAHLAAYEHVSAAAQACVRLGSMSSGRWRSAARELETLQDELHRAFPQLAEAVASRAGELGVEDAAGTLDMLREHALEEVEDDGPAAKVLQGQVLFGVSFVEDPELPDRGTTLLFSWPEPLSPASWPWQANWVAGDGQQNDDEGEPDELDLFEAGELEGADSMLAELADELRGSRQEARTALRDAALALTRASLLAGAFSEDEDEDDDEGDEQE